MLKGSIDDGPQSPHILGHDSGPILRSHGCRCVAASSFGASAGASSTVAAPTAVGVGLGPLPQQVVGAPGSSPSSAIGGGGAGTGVGGSDIDDDQLLDEYMGILEAHHSLDEHCDVDQQRRLAARLVTMATGGKRRLVQQPQDSD